MTSSLAAAKSSCAHSPAAPLLVNSSFQQSSQRHLMERLSFGHGIMAAAMNVTLIVVHFDRPPFQLGDSSTLNSTLQIFPTFHTV